MRAMASQIISLTIVYSTVYAGTGKKNIKAPCHWPLTRKMFPFDDVILWCWVSKMLPGIVRHGLNGKSQYVWGVNMWRRNMDMELLPKTPFTNMV